jgi:hypothetical protein
VRGHDSSRKKTRTNDKQRHDLMGVRCSQGQRLRKRATAAGQSNDAAIIEKHKETSKPRNKHEVLRKIMLATRTAQEGSFAPCACIVKVLLVTTTSTGDGLRAAVGGRRQAAGDTTRTE